MNEILLILNLILIFGGTLLFYKFIGKTGMYCWTAIATILANIEVLIVVEAFGMEQTLGNILFASTFLATDILSENHGKKEAQRAVKIGIFTSISFIIITTMWLFFLPSESDFAHSHIKTIFASTPRVIISGLVVYIITQYADVFLYHRLWKFTEKISGDKKKYLWLRNNCATIISQAMNAILFNLFAFYGTYSGGTLTTIIITTFVIYIFTSLLDTPAVYLARKIAYKKGLA